MTPELDRKLRARYPRLFSRRLMNDEPIRCRDGWFDLLDRLCSRLEAAIAEEPEAERGHFYAQQVKEKFGTLRFYCRTESAAMGNAIADAEEESGRTCDVCGQPGSMNTKRGAVATRCAAHVDVWGIG